VSIWTLLMHAGIAQRWFSWPNILFLSPVPVIPGVIAATEWYALTHDREVLPFLGAVGLFLMSFVGIAIRLWPGVERKPLGLVAQLLLQFPHFVEARSHIAHDCGDPNDAALLLQRHHREFDGDGGPVLAHPWDGEHVALDSDFCRSPGASPEAPSQDIACGQRALAQRESCCDAKSSDAQNRICTKSKNDLSSIKIGNTSQGSLLESTR
jgi:hypothetical protein